MARVEALETEGEEVQPKLPLSPYQKWGLIPKDLSLRDLLTHQFMHAGSLHFFFNMFLLFLLGPPIEDRWGRPVFLGLYLTGGIFAGLFFSATAAGSSIPLVGASGAIAAVMGAFLVRLYDARLRYVYFLYRFGTFHAPAWLMLPLWFMAELWSATLTSDSSGQGGIAYWAHVGGFLYGAGFAGAIRATRAEELFLSRKVEEKLVLVAGNPIVKEIQGLQREGRYEEAYERLLLEMRKTPDDADVVVATWDAASALGRPSEMAGVLSRQIENWIADREIQTATDYWCELTLAVPDAETDPRILLIVAKELHEQDRVLEARRALTMALSHGGDDLNPGLALRFFDIARHRAPELAPEVGRRALTWDQLPAERRRDLLQQIAQVDDRREMDDGAPGREDRWRGPARRALEVELDPTLQDEPIQRRPRLSTPELSEEPESPSPPDFDPAAQTQPRFEPSEAETKPADLSPTPSEVPAPLGSGPRFSSVKVSEVDAKSLDVDELVLQRGEKTHRLPYARIQAIGMGTVYGLGDEPRIVIDLALNWKDPDAQILQVVRVTLERIAAGLLPDQDSDGSPDPRPLIRDLLERSGAIALPDAEALAGGDFSTYPDLALYENLVLDVR